MTTKIITITGEIASGKSTIAEELVKKLPGWSRANTGGKFREITASRGMTIQAVSNLPLEIHREIDKWQRSVAEKESALIMEGRLAGWVSRDLERVFRVFCTAPIDVRISRYAKREDCTEDKAKEEIEFRDSRDVLIYQTAYNLDDYRDPSFYSLILDTSKASPGELADMIINEAGLSTNEDDS